MTDWLTGWERRSERDAGVLLERAGAPRCLLLHTMESNDFAGSMNYLTTKDAWPQLCYDPRSRRKVQGIPLSRAGKALANKPGGVETNRWGVIQVEMPGRAAESHTWPDEWLRNIARDVVVPLVHAVHLQLVAPKFVGTESGFIARPDAPQRFSFHQWLAFDGVCGHQHAPENDHWDPGRLNVPRILEHARSIFAPKPRLKKVSKMVILVDPKAPHRNVLVGDSGKVISELGNGVGKPFAVTNPTIRAKEQGIPVINGVPA